MAKKTATGMTVLGRTLGWTTLVEERGGLKVVAAGHTELESAPEGGVLAADLTEEQRRRVATEVKAGCAGLKGRTIFGLSAQNVFLRVVTLPVASAEELQGMVELQVDKYSPFPAESMVVGYELLDEQDGYYRLLMAAAKRRDLDAVSEISKGAGIDVAGVDVRALGWWRLLHDADAGAETGRRVIVVNEPSDVTLFVAQGQVQVAVRALGDIGTLPEEEYAAELAEEIEYTLTSLEGEEDMAAQGAASIAFWHRGTAPDAVLVRLADIGILEVQPRSLDSLPPLDEGLARRALDGGALCLSPSDWGDARRMRTTRRRMIGATAVVLVVWLAAIGVLFGGIRHEKTRLAEVEDRLRRVMLPAEGVKQTKRRVQRLERYSDNRYSALECFREICERQPAGIDLTAFTYGRARNSMLLTGDAVDWQTYSRFVKALGDSKLFAEVRMGRTTARKLDNENVEHFSVTLILPGEE